ncbi:MAG: hypothetical protein Q3999_06745 [Buchananella hordeovulneris]|nr:hypothetical protein [Buchananella hordeovulneris]
MFVYIPATPALLRRDALEAEVAYAVTADLRAAFPGDHDEELEAIALDCAALHSVKLLEPGEDVRVVVAAEVAPAALTPALDRPDLYAGAVLLTAPVGWKRVDSFYADDLDDAPARAAVAAARALLADAPGGERDEEADELLAEHVLSWYDSTERAKLDA